MNAGGDVVTIKRLAEELGTSVKTVRRWIADRAHPLPCFKPTRRTILIRRADFAMWVESSSPGPKAPRKERTAQ